MTVENEEKQFLFSMPLERRPLIIEKVSQVLEEIEKKSEICGYVFFAFLPIDGRIETWAEYEGICNPGHILEALENYGIIRRIQV